MKGEPDDVATEDEFKTAAAAGSSLLFGEIMPAGVVKMFDKDHLNADGAKSIVDMGAGAFLNIRKHLCCHMGENFLTQSIVVRSRKRPSSSVFKLSVGT